MKFFIQKANNGWALTRVDDNGVTTGLWVAETVDDMCAVLKRAADEQPPQVIPFRSVDSQ